jgi:hypothetical protein
LLLERISGPMPSASGKPIHSEGNPPFWRTTPPERRRSGPLPA